MEELKDLYIRCVDCGNDFTHTAGEQKYFKEHGLYPPKRCPSCRKKKRAQKQGQEAPELNQTGRPPFRAPFRRDSYRPRPSGFSVNDLVGGGSDGR